MGHLEVFLLCFCVAGVCGQTIKLDYVINNQLMTPNFHSMINLRVLKGTPFIRVMEAAADINPQFEFTGAYSSKLGYLITRINKRAANYNVDKTYWEAYNASNVGIEGVSYYTPSDGDVVTFNFTKEA
ncbi:cobalamin binding intrinsic factor-like [Liolophura sinensis]|uniref:cobalamin binding intrinsic factor-like n=1 Tax=Liolophura sinensis TaxID=3198878 RepID=UPI00315923C4